VPVIAGIISISVDELIVGFTIGYSQYFTIHFCSPAGSSPRRRPRR
jgi:hypothetical protein